jgi:hypothetical protein
MGSPLGVFDDDEIADLTDGERAQLRAAIILALRDRGVLKPFLDSNPDIRRAVRSEVANNYPDISKLKLKNQ